MTVRENHSARARWPLGCALLVSSGLACSGEVQNPEPAVPEPPACEQDCDADPLPAGGQSFDDGLEDPPMYCGADQHLVGTRCEPLAEPGGACAENTDCRTGSCRFDGADCVNENCSDYARDGVCGGLGASAEGCVPYADQCAEGLACSIEYVCVALAEVGAPCQSSEDCGELACRSYANGHGCGPFSAQGEACNAYVDCAAGMVCYDDQLCDEPGLAAAGRTCQADPECQEGLVCNNASLLANVLPSCGVPSALGESCLRDGDCEAGALCIGSECRLLGNAGGLCENDLHCGAGLICNYAGPAAQGDALGVCRELAAAGQPCAASADCQAGLTCVFPANPGPGAAGSCGPPS